MRYVVWVALALLVAVIGALVGRVLRLSYAVTVTLAIVPMYLMLFPVLKVWWPKLKIWIWVLAVGLGTAVAWLIYLGFSRFGG